MGFLTGNKTESERIEEHRIKILNEGQVLIDFAVGKHGADEIIAGAMMGETGKYLAMAKYGETKWESTYLLIFNEGIQIYYTGALFYYNEIKSIEVVHKGWLDTEFIIHTSKGPKLFKLFNTTFQALKLIINDLKEKYLQKLSQEKINQQQEELQKKSEEKIDRLIQLGNMYEKGLLSDEEFDSMKEDILDENVEIPLKIENEYNLTINTTDISDNVDNRKFCIDCGTEISSDSKFCPNCGYKLDY